MNLGLQDNVIIVSGGASGIGEAICKTLAHEGAIPCIVDHNEEDALRVEREIKEEGGQAYTFITELMDYSECEKSVNGVRSMFGRINGLVNNAGLNDGVGLEHGHYERFLSSMKKNVVHYFGMAHLVLPSLIQSKGSIVNISSKVAETGQGGTSGYAASNGIRNELTADWAIELEKYKIRVNNIVVAECMTPQYQWWINQKEDPQEKLKEIISKIPLENRMTTPKEIAEMAVFLLSGKSSGINGQLIHVDGGYVHLDRRLA